MDWIKALKKLKKKAFTKQNHSMRQLKKLSDQNLTKITDNQHKNQWEIDLKNLSGQVAMDMASELLVPANPILSWFGTNSYALKLNNAPTIRSISYSAPSSTNQSSNRHVLATTPMKTPPCKKCPALNSGLCKCAVKKFNITN